MKTAFSLKTLEIAAEILEIFLDGGDMESEHVEELTNQLDKAAKEDLEMNQALTGGIHHEKERNT